VLACFAPGAGGTSTGLLAALALETDGAVPTLWVGAAAGGGGLLPEGGVVEPAPRERADTGDAPTPPPLARPPSDADVLAMREEADAVPDFRFHRATNLDDLAVAADLRKAPPALLVVESAPSTPTAAAIRTLRADLADLGLRPPVLLLSEAADPARRDALCRAYGLTDPVRTGGGFDPADVVFGIARVRDENRRRDLVAALLVRTERPGLVLGGDDETTRRLTRGLLTRSARVAALPPPTRHAARTATIGQWRRGSLRALVVPQATLPELDGLGRRGPAFVLVAGGLAGLDRHAILRLVHGLPSRTGPITVVLIATEDEPAVFDDDACRRAALLDEVGEPVAVPCGRCDVCRGVVGDPAALLSNRLPTTDTVSTPPVGSAQHPRRSA
jgi:hypothetical protein